MARTDARHVVLELIRNANGQWDSKTKLFKAFYFAHLFYARKQPGILTNWPIARMPQGPGIHESFYLLRGLVEDGYLTITETLDGPYPEYRYELTEAGKSALIPPDDAKAAIASAAEFALPRSATELSQLTHDRSRSWRNNKDGAILDIYIDLLPDDAVEKDRQQLDQLEGMLADALFREK